MNTRKNPIPPSEPTSPVVGFDQATGLPVSSARRGIHSPLTRVPEDDVFQSGGSLGWDNREPLPTFFRERGPGDAPNHSTSTGFSVPRIEMTHEELVRQALADHAEVKMLAEDDYKDVDPADLASDHLNSMLQDAELLKKKSQSSMLILGNESPDIFPDGKRTEAELAKKLLLSFIRGASKELKDREKRIDPSPTVLGINSIPGEAINPSRSEASRVFKADKVRRYGDDTLMALTSLRDELNAIGSRRPCTDAEFRTARDRFDTAVRKSKSLIADAKTLIEDAVEANEPGLASSIDYMSRKVRESEWEVDTMMNDCKVNLGLIGAAGGAKSLEVDLKPPLFSGELSELDYYTFRLDFEEYVSVKGLSWSQALRVLTRTCLQGPAQSACRDFKSVEEVMKYLKTNYGNPRLLLSRRVQDLRELGTCQGTNLKKRDWAVTVRSKLTLLKELVDKHNLQEELYFSPVIPELQRALPWRLLEDFKDKLKREDEAGNFSRKQIFEKFLDHMDWIVNSLTFEINFSLTAGESEAKTSHKEREGPKPGIPKPVVKKSYQVAPLDGGGGGPRSYSQGSDNPVAKPCPSCPDKHTHVYYCPVFINSKGSERFKVAAKTKSCFKCLRLDSQVDFNNRIQWEIQHQEFCDTSWVCPQTECLQKDLNRQRHFTMCARHANENAQYEGDFVKSLDPKLIPQGTKFFTFFPQVYNVNPPPPPPSHKPSRAADIPDQMNPAIFMLQYVTVNESKLLVFYDSGCAGAAINERAAGVLDTECVRPGPTFMSVAGAATIEIETGDERFSLLLRDKKSVATMTALRMPEITTPFPEWNLEEVWAEVLAAHGGAFPDGPPLAPAPKKIGGASVDVMIGMRYLTLFPEHLFSLPCGLAVYRSRFHASNGETTILGGPHRAWRDAELQSNSMGPRAFFTAEARAYFVENSTINHLYTGVNHDVKELSMEEMFEMEESVLFRSECFTNHCKKHNDEIGWKAPVGWRSEDMERYFVSNPLDFVGAEALGAEIPYRCMRCRNCFDCKRGEILEKVSLREEAEQFIIEESVNYNAESKCLEAVLPFIKSPEENLKNNFNRAFKILETQVKGAAKSEQTRLDVLASHNKLRDKGHVMPLDELPEDVRECALEEPGYYIPWRTVWNASSLSTPCRMVFDASSATPGGECLNNILAKGENKLSNLFSILVRFRTLPFAFTGDVSMAYNGIKLKPVHYRFQKYLWKEDLNPENPVRIMVVKTLIYGVRPSGNQLMAGFNKLADYCIKEYPEHAEGADVLISNTYVDDAVRSCEDEISMKNESESLIFVLTQAGLGVKSITWSGSKPSELVSGDGVHVGVVGLLWDSEKDQIGIDVKPLYFGKMKRGKAPELVTGDVKTALSSVFSRRTLWGQVAKFWDPMGLLTPLTSRLKLDLRSVTLLGLDWDDKIPDEYLDTWVRNLSDIETAKEIRFRRAVIPPDALECQVDMITSTDASENIAVACVHTRVRLQQGGFHVQLMAAKSRLVSTNTIPKAELKGAVMGACISHVVRSNLGAVLNTSLYVTDSTIVLYWIQQDQRPLQTGVRNGVVEIHRFSNASRWFHIETELNVADIGTRWCEVSDLGPTSIWQNGAEWMKMEEVEMPIKTISEITMNGEQKRLAAQEMKASDIHGVRIHSLRTKVADRYGFSEYLVDPNKYSWEFVVRIMSYVLRFVRKVFPRYSPVWRPPVKPEGAVDLVDTVAANPLELSCDDILWGENYFFKLGSDEVKHFCSKKDFQGCTVEKGGILFYTSRVLDGQTIEDPEDAMLDLQPLSFVRPVLDRFSPVAYSIMLHAHGVVSKHRNAICTLRESRAIAYIFRGRDLSIEVRENCVSCRRYRAKLLEVEMGPLHENRLTVAPAFYLVQVDLFGPYQAMCEHNHRSTVKCYGLVFKDPSTSAVAIHMMQNYSTSAFLQAYTRFSSRYGHPAKLFIDAGSQLVKACKEAEISIVDISRELSTKYQVGVDYQTCPVGGHNAHGAVERSIRDIKVLLGRVFSGFKLDLISYETCFAWISNELNCFPICMGSRTSNLDHVDLITPSRLLLGRNNRRSLGGYAKIDVPSRLMDQMDRVYKSWWNVWVTERIVDYIPQSPTWKTTSKQPSVGDIVIFLKTEAEAGFGEPVWRMGRVDDVEYSADGIIRAVIISYKNNNEATFRSTRRSARKIAVLHHEGDLELIEELNQASKDAGVHFFFRNPV